MSDPETATSTFDGGKTVAEAIAARYASLPLEMYGLSAAAAAEAAATSTLFVPPNVVLIGENVSRAGDVMHSGASVTELDLSDNRIAAWEEVGGLLTGMRSLQLLKLSSNPLVATEQLPLSFPVSASLQVLVMANCALDWHTAKSLLALLPNLTQLGLGGNGITQVSHCSHQKLSQLYLNDNLLVDWDQVMQLTGLVNLSLLSLSGNPLFDETAPEMAGPEDDEDTAAAGGAAGGAPIIGNDGSVLAGPSSTDATSAKAPGTPFPRLTSLFLSDTCISKWEQLSMLASLTTVTHFRLQHIPLLDHISAHASSEHVDPNDYCRRILVACLPGATHLNGSLINDRDRVFSERSLVRHFKFGKDIDMAHTPSVLPTLQAKYPDLHELADVSLEPQQVITVTVFAKDTPVTEMPISVYTTVSELKDIVAPIVHIEAGEQYVWFVDATLRKDRPSKSDNRGEENRTVHWRNELNSDERQLYSYSMKDGYEIHVSRKSEETSYIDWAVQRHSKYVESMPKMLKLTLHDWVHHPQPTSTEDSNDTKEGDPSIRQIRLKSDLPTSDVETMIATNLQLEPGTFSLRCLAASKGREEAMRFASRQLWAYMLREGDHIYVVKKA